VQGTLSELNVLLTGGRLNTMHLEEICNGASSQDPMKTVQKAIVLSSAFNTLGDAQPTGLREVVDTAAATGPVQPYNVTAYKAVVLLFLEGGADTFNMLVPREGELWTQYQSVRGIVKLEEDELDDMKINTTGQSISTFSLHPRLKNIRQMYEDRKLAFVSNIGNLREPVTKAKFLDGTAKLCPTQFAHPFAQQAAQTLDCANPASAAKGSGGRLADELVKGNFRAATFSIAGHKPWTIGRNTSAFVISPKMGAVLLEELGEDDSGDLQNIIDNITSTTHHNIYSEEYAKSLGEAISDSKNLSTHFKAASDIENDFVVEEDDCDDDDDDACEAKGQKIADQLGQVAKLMKRREERQAERDFFYVRLPGYDAHQGVEASLNDGFNGLDNALKLFVDWLEKDESLWQSTVIVTHSDFGRTLSPNAKKGTDHAWAGNHMVLGGNVNGGIIFNDFPETLELNSHLDVGEGRGRLIPKYPFENVMVPIAKWMGVESLEQLNNVFPNLKWFEPDLILERETLFNS
jgi:uncharacterized protein (DUF1501 family)